jgi:toxin HigB-1
VTRYTIQMIKSFRHGGIEKFFSTGSKAGIQPSHAVKLSLQLFQLNRARAANDMNAPGWELHPLRGGLKGHSSVKVNVNWRLTFAFEGSNAILVDYQDYH